MWEDRKYVVLTADEAEDVEYDKVLNTIAETLPWNDDKSKCIVKYVGNKPRFLYGKDVLNHSQAIAWMGTEEWNPQSDETP